MERLNRYKNTVWQTVLLSRSNRVPTSNNVLETCRYPIKAPECLDGERVQTMMFMPFCAHYTGIHTTFYQKVNGAGTNLEHATGVNDRLDVIQRKANTADHLDHLRPKIDGSDVGAPVHNSETINLAAALHDNNYARSKDYMDQVVRQVDVDLVFTASRAFPVVVSVSVVRFIQPIEPYNLSTDDKRQLCNGIDNKGMEWTRFKTEWHTEFTLPALKKDTKPPTRSVNKKLLTNWMQTSALNELNTAQEMTEAQQTALGMNIHSHQEEFAKGFASGQFVVLIKYRKKQQPTQFTYTHAIDASSDGSASRFPQGTVEMPALTEESFDIPTHAGVAGNNAADGAPFKTDQGNEGRASFYLHGKLGYQWGFRHEVEAIPSMITTVDGNVGYKKPMSLNIDPSYPNDTGAAGSEKYGLYVKSEDHVTAP
jgi:hypothetical protein